MSIDPTMIDSIVTPPNWSAEKDMAAFQKRWEPHPDPVVFVLGKVSELYQELSDLLTSAVSFYMTATDVSWRAAKCMGFSDKISWLETFTLIHEGCASYRGRVCADLKVCRWVYAERCRIIGSHLTENGSGWMYPLIRFSDRLTTALTDLEQTLKAEVDGCTRFQTR